MATSAELFYANGFGAVGVDRIIAEAGVAKATLYRHFRTKDELVVAYLQQANDDFWAWIEGGVGPDAEGADLLVEIFRLIEAQATSPVCRGCAFQATAAEFPDPTHPAHAVAAAHKREALDRFTAIATDAGLRDPRGLASTLLLLMDGAWAATRMFGADNHSAGLAATVRRLVAADTDTDG